MKAIKYLIAIIALLSVPACGDGKSTTPEETSCPHLRLHFLSFNPLPRRELFHRENQSLPLHRLRRRLL